MSTNTARPFTIVNQRVELGDPHLITDDRDLLGVRNAVYEPLVRLDNAGIPQPVLAERCSCDDSARSWIFELRRGVTFHDGSGLEAEDMVATLRRVTTVDIGGELAAHGVYQSYLAGATFNAVDRNTVRVTTAEPLADLLDLLATIAIIPRSFADGDDHRPVGTGPFRVTAARNGMVGMEAFDGYWGLSPRLLWLQWRAEPRSRQRVDQLLSGEADLVSAVPYLDRQSILESGQAIVFDATTSVCVAFLGNLRHGPCRDRRVRQALNFGANVDEIIEQVGADNARPLNGPLTPSHIGYDPDLPAFPYEPDRAMALLRDAGYGDGLDLVVDVPTSLPDEAPRLAHILAEQYRRIGVRLSIRLHENRQAYAEMVRAKQIGDLCCFDSSPQSTYRVLREKLHGRIQGPWWQGYANPDVDSLVDTAARTPDMNERSRLYRLACRLIHDDAPWIFLYNPVASSGVTARGRDMFSCVNGVITFT